MKTAWTSFLARLLTGLLLTLPTTAMATQYLVSKSGSDNNNGVTAPFLTIQKAVSVVKAGDVITVAPGVYSGPVSSSASGTASAPITLKAQFPAFSATASNRTVLTGSNSTGTGLSLTGSHWIVDGLEVTKFLTGVMFSTGAHFGIARNNLLRGNDGAGITCWQCNDLHVENNYFEDLGPAYPDLDVAVMDYGVNFYYAKNPMVQHNYFFGKFNHDISFKNNVFNGAISNNIFDGCMYACIELGQNPDNSSEGDKTSQGAVVENNIFRDAVDGSTGAYYRVSVPVTVMNIRDAVIRNNLMENVYGGGVRVYYDFREGDIRLGLYPGSVKIYGNTMVNFRSKDPYSGEGGGGTSIRVQVRQGNSDDVVEVYNNTMMGREILAEAGTVVIEKNNILSDSSQFVGPLSVYDPFANRGAHPADSPNWSRAQAYHLVAGSKYIDTAANVGLPYSGAAPDMGSNEFIPGTQAPASQPTPAPAPSPAPADTMAPATAITSPANNSLLRRGSQIQIQASASDNVGVVKVEFYSNGRLIGTKTSAPYAQSLTLSSRRGVKYQLQTKAYDAAGNSRSSAIINITTSR